MIGSRLKTCGVAALLVLACGAAMPNATVAMAQSGSNAGDSGQGITVSSIDIDFPGGTVGEYVQMLRRLLPDANVAVDANAQDLRVAPVQLRNVQAYGACYALQTLTVTDWGESGVIVDDHAGVFSIRANPNIARSIERVSAVSLAQILSMGVNQDDALSVMETGVTMADPDATLKFHAETGVLLLSGNDAAREAASNVLSGLERHAQVLERQATRSREEADRAKQQAESSELEQYRLQAARANEAQRESQGRLEEMHSRLMSVTEEAERQKVRVEALEHENQVLRAEVAELRLQVQKQGE